MGALAIDLPDALMRESTEAARQLRMSRAAFIRMAIQDEIKKVHRELKEAALLQSLQTLARSAEYMKESEELEGLASALPHDEEGWWTQS